MKLQLSIKAYLKGSGTFILVQSRHSFTVDHKSGSVFCFCFLFVFCFLFFFEGSTIHYKIYMYCNHASVGANISNSWQISESSKSVKIN